MKPSLEKLALPFFVVIVSLLAIALALLIRVRLDVAREQTRPAPESPTPTTTAPVRDREAADEIACKRAGGNWNPCGSACRGAPPETVCIQVCVPQCACGGIAGFRCPEGSVCGDYEPPGAADALGVCKPIKEEKGI